MHAKLGLALDTLDFNCQAWKGWPGPGEGVRGWEDATGGAIPALHNTLPREYCRCLFNYLTI